MYSQNRKRPRLESQKTPLHTVRPPNKKWYLKETRTGFQYIILVLQKNTIGHFLAAINITKGKKTLKFTSNPIFMHSLVIFSIEGLWEKSTQSSNIYRGSHFLKTRMNSGYSPVHRRIEEIFVQQSNTILPSFTAAENITLPQQKGGNRHLHCSSASSILPWAMETFAITPVTWGRGETPSQLRNIKVQLETIFGRAYREKTGISI